MAYTEKYVRTDAGGSGDGSANTPSAAWTLLQAAANYTPGDRVNIIEGTYGPYGQHVELYTDANEFDCIEWRGRNAADTGPAMAIINTDTYVFRASGGGIYFNHLDLRGSSSGYTVYNTEASNFWHKCSFYNSTTTSSGSGTAMFAQAAASFVDCFFQTDATTDRLLASYTGALYLNRGIVWGCKAKGKYPFHISTSYSGVVARNNILIGNGTGAGMILDTMSVSTPAPDTFVNNTFYNHVDGIIIEDGPKLSDGGTVLIKDNLFHTCSGYAINNKQEQADDWTGTTIQILKNAYYNCSSGYLGGFSYNGQTVLNPIEDPIHCTADPCVNAGNGDFSLNSNPNGGLLLKKVSTNPVYDWSF